MLNQDVENVRLACNGFKLSLNGENTNLLNIINDSKEKERLLTLLKK